MAAEQLIDTVWNNFAYVVGVTVLSIFILIISTRTRYPDVPTLKISKRPGILGTWDDAKLWVSDGLNVLLLGYEEYSSKGKHYLVSRPEGKMLVVAPAFVEEVRRAPETHVQNAPANNELSQLKHTLHVKLEETQFHQDIPLRKNLTESLGPKLPDIVEEAKLSLRHRIGLKKQYVPLQMSPLGFQVVTRTANRLLFGIDLTRNEEFDQLSIDYTGVFFGGAEIVRSWPEWLKPVVMWLKTDVHRANKIAYKHLAPVITERIQQRKRAEAKGTLDVWAKTKPDDAIQWVLDVCPPEHLRVDHLVFRMLHLNIGAIHTSSISFLETMYFLCLYPQYHAELRAEIEQVFRSEGKWTKQGLTRLMRLDSFIAEALRLCPFTALKMQRYVIRDWTMSDGTIIPKGTFFWCNYLPQNLDDNVWENAKSFDPWRMYRSRQQPGQENKHQWVMTTPLNLTFGHGKHACPGRFFAANEIKTLLALFITLYDFRATNLKGSVEEIVFGGWINQTKNPVDHPIVEFKYRGEDIPADIRPLFTEL